MFHGRGTGSPSSIAKRTHPGRHTCVTRKGPSQQGESLFMPSQLSTRLRTRSSTWSSASHDSLIVALEYLPVACIFNSRLPSSLVN
jgi:hypothetical protein